ncbi:5-carboxymethyl-2-hydroxymuconate Delta-isomerase [Legionella sp. CNM-4043-24]|uniref:5-carboxymethyl-2-hydroxymuconate Delta-isomerase n=1 Tax=Legionella sp. CNM-4043-24 TaxID=3421646 RepID=UPI00403AB1E7
MPHITLEYSSNVRQPVDLRPLFDDIHQLLTRELPTQLSSCKSRALPCEQYLLGAGEPNVAFAHLHIKIMAGRSTEKKTYLGHVLLEMMNQFFRLDAAHLDLQLSVEIEDLDPFYFKKQANVE